MVDWNAVTVPGSVCDGVQPIVLRAGTATIDAPPGVDAGTPQLVVSEGQVIYGDLLGGGQEVAAVNVWCSNTGGTADGQYKDSWIVYSADTGAPQVIGVMTPQVRGDPASHVPYFDTDRMGIEIDTRRIIARQLWYGPSDSTCCPTGRATTVWSYAHGVLTATSTTQGWS